MEKIKCSEKQTHLGRVIKATAVVVVGVGFWIGVPAIIFSQIEGSDYGTSLYYCIVSLSTVGFGDFVPG